MVSSPMDPTDRRVLRTRLALRDALLSLMTERGWDDVSVQDICDRANVGRSTFYMHFQGKAELLDGGLEDFRTALRAMSAHRSTSPQVLPFLRGLIDHVYEQRKLFCSIIGKRSGHVVQTRFRDLLYELVHEDLSRFMKAGWQCDAAAHYIAGALFDVLAWLAETKSSIRADEIEDWFWQLLKPTILRLKEKKTLSESGKDRI